MVETLVTTRILGRIVEKAGDSQIIDDLLVGFKYVAHVLKSLERTGRYGQVVASPQDLVLAAEESHGVIMIPTIRDKDAAPACMFLAALYQRLWLQGCTLLDYYVGILEQLGGYADVGRSIAMAGAGACPRRDRLMASLERLSTRDPGGPSSASHGQITGIGKVRTLRQRVRQAAEKRDPDVHG